MFLVIT